MNIFQSNYFIYIVVFCAIVLPVALWRRSEKSVYSDKTLSQATPGIFRLTWSLLQVFEYPLGPMMAKLMPLKALKYNSLIRASGLPLTSAKVFVLQVFSLLGGSIIGLVIAIALLGVFPGMGWGGCVGITFFFAFSGWIYPSIALEKYVQWRQNELVRSLPFAIDLIGSAMRSGLEFGAAMRYFTSLKMPGPLTEEFGTVLQQIELGKTRVEALEDMAYRIQVEEFTSFAGVVSYGTEIGASIADTLRVHGEDLRRARFHLAECKAARAPSLMILPMAVFIMPAVFIIIITPIIMRMKGSGMMSH